MSETRPDPAQPALEQGGALENLWQGLKNVPTEVKGGLEGLWDHLKSGHAKAEADLPKPMQVIKGAGEAIAGDIGDIAKGFYEAGPGTLEKVATGKLPPGAPETEEAARTTALTYGFGKAPEGALATGIGRGPGIPGITKTEPLPPGQKAGLTDIARGVAHTLESWFSPTTIDQHARMAEFSINKGRGQALRDTAIANQQLEQFRHLTAPLTAEFDDYVQMSQQARQNAINAGVPYTSNLPKPAALRFIDYMEGRSTGAQLDPDIQHLQPLADTLKTLMNERRAKIQADPLTNVQSFIDDYYSHQWREKTLNPTLLGQGRPRMGSGTSLQQRKIPTISEGINAGYTPTSFDPIETSMRYIANMDAFLASNEIFATGKNSGMIRFFNPGQAPNGWAPLNGRLAQTPFQRAYAPEGYARVYNRSSHVDPGFLARQPAFQAWNAAKNGMTQAVLGFPGYHYMAMSQEAAVSKFTNALGHLSDGEFGEMAKKMGLAATQIGPVIEQARKGGKVVRAYLRTLDPADPAAAIYNRIADDIAAAGGRLARGKEWRATPMDDYFTAIKRGTLRAQVRMGLRDVAEGPISMMPFRAAGNLLSEAGRIMETVNKPLFHELIPRLKGGAFFDEMEQWIAQNPTASKMEEIAKANELWDQMDNRFGEMVMDRVFWNQNLKTLLQGLMVSPGWELGSARALGGGVIDIGRGGVQMLRGRAPTAWKSPTARWVVGMVAIGSLMDATYQYLRTGQPPQSVTDLMAPRTGGTTPEGAPERAILPGYEKDVLGWSHDWKAKISGMMGPATRLAQEAWTGKDWRGQPIALTGPGTDPAWQQWTKHILESIEPIPFQQEQRKLPGSKISMLESSLGIRPAPGYVTDPDRTRLLQRAHDLKESIDALNSQIADQRRRLNPQEMQKLMRQRVQANVERKRVIGQINAHDAAIRQSMGPRPDTLEMAPQQPQGPIPRQWQ